MKHKIDILVNYVMNIVYIMTSQFRMVQGPQRELPYKVQQQTNRGFKLRIISWLRPCLLSITRETYPLGSD
eukprot:2058840-Amphidinium_carterae.1